MRAAAAAIVSGFMLAACPGPGPERVPPPPDPACYVPGHFTFLETDTQVYRQGAAVRVTPKVNAMPFGYPEIPLTCTSDWAVTGPATLSADRRTVTIAPDAQPGAMVSIAFTHNGRPAGTSFRVVGRDEVVLTGRRAQSGVEGCAAAERIGEIEFTPENRFSVTFRPFETYKDYWGTYAYDPATKQLRLTVEGGNFVPTGLDLEGEADLVSGRLVLRDMFLGSREFDPPLDTRREGLGGAGA